MRGRHGRNNTTDRGRQRDEHRRYLKDTVGHGKSKYKTQQDMIQRHGNQIATGEYRTQNHILNITQRLDSRVMTG